MWQDAASGVVYVLGGLVVLLIAKLVNDLTTPYRLDEELTVKDNPALGLTLTGYFAGVIIVYVGAIWGPDLGDTILGRELGTSLARDVGYALGGVALLNVSRFLVDRLMLPGFSTSREIVEDRNVGTGAVEAGAYVATALVLAGSITGTGGGPLTALAFFVLGQLALALFARVYQLVTRYDIHAEIERDNVAAGVALGMSLVAVGIILLKATAGDFVDWPTNLTAFAWNAGIGFVVLSVLRRVADGVFLPRSTIAHEIAVDRNLNAAWIEGIVAIGVATIILVAL